MRKTVDIDDDLKAMIDRLRKEHGKSMKEIINNALRRGLRKMKRSRARRAAQHNT